MKKAIVSYSGGLTSFEAGRRAMESGNYSSVEWWFCDTLSEDPDLYRFNLDVQRLLNVKIRRLVSPKLSEARKPRPDDQPGAALWDLFDAQGMIANTRADLCSRIAKRELFRRTLEAECDPGGTVVVIGMDEINDCERIKSCTRAFLPWETAYPLVEPVVFKDEIAEWLSDRGIVQPSLYDAGAPHNNCGGFCVKAGLGQFAWLLASYPERYAYHEKREAEFRKRTGKDVAILRDRRGGDTKPMTLAALRARVEFGESFSLKGGESCSCFSSQLELFPAS